MDTGERDSAWSERTYSYIESSGEFPLLHGTGAVRRAGDADSDPDPPLPHWLEPGIAARHAGWIGFAGVVAAGAVLLASLSRPAPTDVPAPVPVPLPTVAPPPSLALTAPAAFGEKVPLDDPAVYADALQNGWQDWSWARVDLTNPAPAHSGAVSVSVTAGPWQGFRLRHEAFYAAPGAVLSFWIHGGRTGGQRLQVQATLDGSAQPPVLLPTLRAATWKKVVLPMSRLGAGGKPNVDGFWIQEAAGVAAPTFYVDDIAVSSPAPATARAARPLPPPEPGAYPQRNSPPSLPATFVTAVSGDGMVVRRTDGGGDLRLRLFGTDAPEWDQPGGTEALAALERMTAHKHLRVQYIQAGADGWDSYKVYVGATLVNEQMVRQGYSWWVPSWAAGSDVLRADQAEARAAGRGLWSRPAPVAPWDWRAGKRSP